MDVSQQPHEHSYFRIPLVLVGLVVDHDVQVVAVAVVACVAEAWIAFVSRVLKAVAAVYIYAVIGSDVVGVLPPALPLALGRLWVRPPIPLE